MRYRHDPRRRAWHCGCSRLSLETPKPLLKVGGRTMLDHALDKLVAAGVMRAVVNTFYLADQIEQHLRQRRDIEIIISHETELLDTGGGIKNALAYFDAPFLPLMPICPGRMDLSRLCGACAMCGIAPIWTRCSFSCRWRRRAGSRRAAISCWIKTAAHGARTRRFRARMCSFRRKF